MPRQRMSRDDRRRAIVRAVAPVFASRGFRGATTRELAAAAGVSEGLLYRYFPSKEALYEAITSEHIADRELHPGIDRLLAMEPSTRRLVLCVEHLVGHVYRRGDDDFPRLMAQSLLGDGAFARAALARFGKQWGGFLRASIAAARAAGDLESEASDEAMAQWCLQHLVFGLRLVDLPPRGAVRYGRSRKKVVEAVVRFALRGLGLRPEALARDYEPGAWRKV